MSKGTTPASFFTLVESQLRDSLPSCSDLEAVVAGTLQSDAFQYSGVPYHNQQNGACASWNITWRRPSRRISRRQSAVTDDEDATPQTWALCIALEHKDFDVSDVDHTSDDLFKRLDQFATQWFGCDRIARHVQSGVFRVTVTYSCGNVPKLVLEFRFQNPDDDD